MSPGPVILLPASDAQGTAPDAWFVVASRSPVVILGRLREARRRRSGSEKPRSTLRRREANQGRFSSRRTGPELVLQLVGVAGFEPTACSSRIGIMTRRDPALYPKGQVVALVRVGMTKPAKASFSRSTPRSLPGWRVSDPDQVGASAGELVDARLL